MVYEEGVGKPGLLNKVAGEAVRLNEMKLIMVELSEESLLIVLQNRHP